MRDGGRNVERGELGRELGLDLRSLLLHTVHSSLYAINVAREFADAGSGRVLLLSPYVRSGKGESAKRRKTHRGLATGWTKHGEDQSAGVEPVAPAFGD